MGRTTPCGLCVSGSKPGSLFAEIFAFMELALFANIERRHGTVIAHDARPDFARLAFVVAQCDGEAGMLCVGCSDRHSGTPCFGVEKIEVFQLQYRKSVV